MTAATPTIVVSRSVSSGGSARATIDESASARPAATATTMSCTRRTRAVCRRAAPRTVGLALLLGDEQLEGPEDGAQAGVDARVGEAGGPQEAGQAAFAHRAGVLDA